MRRLFAMSRLSLAHTAHAKSAKYRYHPGALSHLYQKMSAAERSSIDREVDAAFQKETGRTRKLDWNHANDRPEARLWLLMRDQAVARFYLSRLQKVRAASATKMANYFQDHLKDEAEERGLPEAEREGASFASMQAAHIAVEVLDGAGFGGLWEALEIEGAAELTLGLVGPLLTLAAGLAEIGEKHASGRKVSERNGFRYGFAATLHAMANGGDWSGADSTSTTEGQMQFRGRNAAVRMVREMGPEIGKRFLARYAGPFGKDVAVKDLGGYESQLPK
jgi:hypothetical protein